MTDTPVMRALRDWEVYAGRMEAPEFFSAMTDEEAAPLIDRKTAMEDALLLVPAQDAGDLFAKVAAYTDWGSGEFPTRRRFPEFWQEARRLLGRSADATGAAPADPLVETGRALADALRAEDAADMAMMAARGTNDREALEAAHSGAQNHVFDLRRALGQHRATTLEGCLVQLAEACQIVSSLACSGRDDNDPWVEEEEARAQRCLYSVAAVLEGLTGQRIDPDLGLGAMMPERLNPWREETAAE